MFNRWNNNNTRRYNSEVSGQINEDLKEIDDSGALSDLTEGALDLASGKTIVGPYKIARGVYKGVKGLRNIGTGLGINNKKKSELKQKRARIARESQQNLSTQIRAYMKQEKKWSTPFNLCTGWDGTPAINTALVANPLTTGVGVKWDSNNRVLLNGISQGAGNDQRIGNDVTINMLQISFKIWAATDITSSRVRNARVIVIYDKLGNNDASGIIEEQVFINANDDWTIPLFDSYPKLIDNRPGWVNPGRFRIIKDVNYEFSNIKSAHTTMWNIPCNLKTQYMDSDKKLSSIRKGQIYIVVINRQISGESPSFVINWQGMTRCRFTDL